MTPEQIILATAFTFAAAIPTVALVETKLADLYWWMVAGPTETGYLDERAGVETWVSDGTWTAAAIAFEVGPVLFNVHVLAEVFELWIAPNPDA